VELTLLLKIYIRVRKSRISHSDADAACFDSTSLAAD